MKFTVVIEKRISLGKNSGTEIASHLSLSEKSVSRCIERGKKMLGNDEKLLDYIQ